MAATVASIASPPKAQAIVLKAKEMTINSAGDYELAVELGKAAAELRRKITDFFKPMKRKADEAKKAILDEEKKTLAPVEEAELILKRKVTEWRVAEDERRRAETRRLEELSLRQAQKAIDKGQTEKAEMILNKPIEVSSDVPVVSGMRRTVRWKFEVTNELEIPREYMVVNHVRIGEFVRANKDKSIGVIPGIRVYSEEDTGF